MSPTDSQRTIVHLDADAFFASVEQAADSRLRGKPVAVGGERRGIIASASYEARKFGVYTPMPTARARKLCPKLIVLPGDFERYEQFSRWMFGYCYDFTPEVEQTSIDEGYFDLTANRRKSPLDIALTIRKAIAQALKISVSEGIAVNKLVSQIASKLGKPAAFREVPRGEEQAFLHPLPNRWLPGVGPKTGARLDAAGLAEIRHIAATPLELLELLLGGEARTLRQFAHGIDERPLVLAAAPAKSFSEQQTFAQDLTDEDYLEATLRRMADHLFARVREERRSIRTIMVKVRYNDMAEGQASESLIEPTDLETDVYGRLRGLLKRAWRRRVSLRMVSLKLSQVYDGVFRSNLPLCGESQEEGARARLARIVDALRKRRGGEAILRGHDFRLREAPSSEGDFENPPRRLDIASDAGTASPHNARLAARESGPIKRGEALKAPASAARSETIYIATSRAAEPATSYRRTAQSSRAPSISSTITYVPLRVHSYYSFLDSTLSPAAAVALAKEHGMQAVALTDYGNLHGAVEFAEAARREGIKPIFGVEIAVQLGKQRAQPLLLLVENARGYHNLCRLLSRGVAFGARNKQVPARDAPRDAPNDSASVMAEERRPFRVDELLGRTDGLTGISACAALSEIFPGRFYHAVTTKHLDAGFPAIAVPPIHYATRADRMRYDIVQSIRTRTLLRQTHPDKRLSGQFHFRAPAEMRTATAAHPEWLAHTLEIAERCNFDLPLGAPQFPAFVPPATSLHGSTAREYLRHLVLEGLERRYARRRDAGARGIAGAILNDLGEPVPFAQVRAQIDTELAIIAEVGYEDYFLITWQMLQHCRERGIEWITRGSAADSLVCYCLGISDVCPVRFGLYFRRFLNRERMALNKLPDIDIDFPHDRKDDVVALLFELYGPEHCAVVGGFSTFQARSAVGDVAKALGVSEYQIRRFTEHFPWGFGGGWVTEDFHRARGAELIEILRATPECRDLPLDEEPYKTAIEMAAFLDGFPRHPKMHPCGVVVSRQPMHELTPLFVANKGYPTTHFDMDAVEAIGLVKMDILAQGGLAVMRDARAALAARGVATDLAALEPWDDPAVWELIANGDARAVHHIESPAMISLCRMTNVREIDGLIAIVSVIRPGAANEQKKVKFTRRYQKMEPPEYPHPSLESCLRSTFGLVVYEEHILQICEAFAGLSPGRADVLRRALVKQKFATVKEIGVEFAEAARARGHGEEKIAEVWTLVTGFSGYAFCKAHSTAYGVEAYQAAWLKRYYPAEFMAGVLTNGKGFYHPIVYVLECHRLGIPLLPPSVNTPGPAFTVEYSAIRVPLMRAKHLTERTIDRLLEERARALFVSLADFQRRVVPTADEMTILVRIGAFDEFGKTRTAQFWEGAVGQSPLRGLQTRDPVAPATPAQAWLIPPPGVERIAKLSLAEPTRRQRLLWEIEAFEFAVSGHPLEIYDDIDWQSYCPVARLAERAGETVVTCGLIVESRGHHQITGEPMKFLTLADWTGMVETELFAATYRNYGLATVRYPVLEITATVEPFTNGRGYTLRVHRAGKPRKKVKRQGA